MAQQIVRISNVSKRFERDGFEVVALDNVSLDIHEGDFFEIEGLKDVTNVSVAPHCELTLI